MTLSATVVALIWLLLMAYDGIAEGVLPVGGALTLHALRGSGVRWGPTLTARLAWLRRIRSWYRRWSSRPLRRAAITWCTRPARRRT